MVTDTDIFSSELDSPVNGGGYIVLTPEAVAAFLTLPKGVQVVGADWDFYNKCVKLYLRGAGLPYLAPGVEASRLFPALTMVEGLGKQLVVTWDFSQPER